MVVHLYKVNGAWVWRVRKNGSIMLRSKKPEWTEERAVRRALGAVERSFGKDGPPVGFQVRLVTDQSKLEFDYEFDGEPREIHTLPEDDA
jgi:hypothetical protein